MKVGASWEVRGVTVEDWLDVASSLQLEPDAALAVVEPLRKGLPDAVATAADAAPSPFRKEAQKVAAAVGRQRHLHAPRLARARRGESSL
jgi:serine/threonine-protein kinase HipA